MARSSRTTVLAGLLLLVLLGGCGEDAPTPPAEPSRQPPASPGSSGHGDRDLADRAEDLARQGVPDDARVVVVSIDGLGSASVTPALTPTLTRLLAEGAGTRNARTAVERTETLPNHTSMVTGRRIAAAAGGHGVTWNTDTDQRVPRGVSSVFEVIAEHGGSAAVVVGKGKFDLWPQSWPDGVDRFRLLPAPGAAVTAAVAEVGDRERDLTFLHLPGPDRAGHADGWGSPSYDAAVRRADASVSRLVTAIRADPDLADEIVLVVTADHGGEPGTVGHADPRDPDDYTIPFVVWGAGVASGDLYVLNPGYADPGTGRPSYDGAQPVRNGDVANLVTGLLGVPPVPGSQLGTGPALRVE